MNSILYLSVLISWSAFFNYTASSSSHGNNILISPETYYDYYNMKYMFAIKYPPGWITDETEYSNGLVFSTQKRSDSPDTHWCKVTIVIAQNVKGNIEDISFNGKFSKATESIPRFKLIYEVNRKRNDYKCRECVYTAFINNKDAKMMVDFLWRNNTLFTITLVSTRNDFVENKETFNYMMDNFKFMGRGY